MGKLHMVIEVGRVAGGCLAIVYKRPQAHAKVRRGHALQQYGQGRLRLSVFRSYPNRKTWRAGPHEARARHDVRAARGGAPAAGRGVRVRYRLAVFLIRAQGVGLIRDHGGPDAFLRADSPRRFRYRSPPDNKSRPARAAALALALHTAVGRRRPSRAPEVRGAGAAQAVQARTQLQGPRCPRKLHRAEWERCACCRLATPAAPRPAARHPSPVMAAPPRTRLRWS